MRIYYKINSNTYTYEPRTNAELRAMFNEPDIVGILKSRRISWAAGYVWRAESQTLCEITIWKPDKKVRDSGGLIKSGKQEVRGYYVLLSAHMFFCFLSL